MFHGGAAWRDLQASHLPYNTRHHLLPGCQAILVAVANRSAPGLDAALEDGLRSASSSHLDAPVGVRHLESLKTDNAFVLPGLLQIKPEGALFVPSGFVL